MLLNLNWSTNSYLYDNDFVQQSINSNRRKTVIEYLNRLGDILAEIEVLGGSSIFRIATEAFSYKETRLKGYDNIGSSLPTGIIDKAILASDMKSINSTLYKRQNPIQHPLL